MNAILRPFWCLYIPTLLLDSVSFFFLVFTFVTYNSKFSFSGVFRPLCLFEANSALRFCQHLNNHFKDKSENCHFLLCPLCTQSFTAGRNWLRHYEAVNAVVPKVSHSQKEKAAQSSKKSSSAYVAGQDDAWCLGDQNQNDSMQKTEESSREKVTKFLLRLQCEHGISKTVTSFVASEMQELIDTALKEQNDGIQSGTISVKQACVVMCWFRHWFRCWFSCNVLVQML